MTAAELKALKTKINTVMSHRSGTTSGQNKSNGDVGAYAGTAYAFSETPGDSIPLKVEHGQKTVNLLRKINTTIGGRSVGPEVQYAGQAIDTDTFTNANLTAIVNTLESEYSQANRGAYAGYYNGSAVATATEVSSCAAACTGLCKGNCFGKCNGCSGLCGGGCWNNCAGSCGYGQCTGCSSTCTGACQTACTGSCQGGCKNQCDTACTGCSGCTGGCTDQCTGVRAD